jgi:hypothetical protein
MNDLDERVRDAVDGLPGKERRAMMQSRYRSCVDTMVDELGATEQVRSISCAQSPKLGRGVLALTDDRLVFCCTRSGSASWSLSEIRAVEGRRGAFTLPSAITLHTADERLVFTLGVGRRYGPTFVAAVEAAMPAASGMAA